MKEFGVSQSKEQNHVHEGIIIEDHYIDIHIKDYHFISSNGETKLFYGDKIDEIYHLSIEDMTLKITKRTLYNKDVMLFIEGKQPTKKSIHIDIDKVITGFSFEQEYKKPPYDNRYGENKLSGPSCYIDLVEGSAMISKIYYYKELIKEYEDGKSYVLELIKESNSIRIMNDKIICELEDGREYFSLALIISKDKLFKDESRLNEYIKFYFESVANNSVWCSFFMRPSGTYTKLPYSIEPFTRDGYGFSLHHSSKRELLSFFKETKERFYYDLLENAILQAYMYQENEEGLFYSNYTSTWVKNGTGIVAPYIDTRLNETFFMTVNEFLPYTPIKAKLDPIIHLMEYLYKYLKSGHKLYIKETGFLFPDYFKEEVIKVSHTSLNHQLGLANLAYNAYQHYQNEKYLEIYNGIIKFVENTKEEWINPDNGDLYYGLKLDEKEKYSYFGKDYTYVTLIDLLYAQKAYQELNNGKINESLRFLTTIKLNYLKGTEYDLEAEVLQPSPGESIDSVYQAIKLLETIYDMKDEVVSMAHSFNNATSIDSNEFPELETLSEILLRCKTWQVKDERVKSRELVQKIKESNIELERNKEKVMSLNNEIKQHLSELEVEKNKVHHLKQELDKEINQSKEFLSKLEECTSSLKEEQMRVSELKNKCQEYEQILTQYTQSKGFKIIMLSWKLKSKLKFLIKRSLYKISHWIYVKLMPYPKLRSIGSKVNSKLGLFKDTQKVVCWNDKNHSQSMASKKSKDNHLKQAKKLNVAMIVDEFTYNSFKYECNALPIEPNNWKQVFKNNDIDLFFCESAWAGVDSVRRPWRGKVYCSTNFKRENRTELLEILKYCKENNIPTVFWNKEDPTHYPDRIHDFVNTAIKFDHIFTTDRGCVERYKKDYGHKSVHVLMFATQPKLFNPIEKFSRSKEIIFAGSWYNQHPTRCEEMGAILDRIIKSPYELKIYDRHSETEDPNHYFPDRFKQYLNPCLPHEKMEIAYKSSEYALNINTVTDSETMFARRVFELMSSNTLVLSNYSKGMEELFGDKVIFVDKDEEILLEEAEEKREEALYTVLKHHTYKQRFEQILNQINFNYLNEVDDVTLIFRVNSLAEADKMYAIFENIEYKYKSAIFYVSKDCLEVDLRKMIEKYNTNLITVISQGYCQNYKDVLKIHSKYFIVANENIENTFINKAFVHFDYVEHNVGITNGEHKYTFGQQTEIENVLFANEQFETIKAKINSEDINSFKVYSI